MSLPVILCAKTVHIGAGIINALQPEYEVIHLVTEPEIGAIQIPAILRGELPPPPEAIFGSGNYSMPPVAVILSYPHHLAGVHQMMEASKGIKPIPWLCPDLNRPAPPLGPLYGKMLIARIKDLLAQLNNGGRMNEEVLWWY